MRVVVGYGLDVRAIFAVHNVVGAVGALHELPHRCGHLTRCGEASDAGFGTRGADVVGGCTQGAYLVPHAALLGAGYGLVQGCVHGGAHGADQFVSLRFIDVWLVQ